MIEQCRFYEMEYVGWWREITANPQVLGSSEMVREEDCDVSSAIIEKSVTRSEHDTCIAFQLSRR
jgi:hypothetical protein